MTACPAASWKQSEALVIGDIISRLGTDPPTAHEVVTAIVVSSAHVCVVPWAIQN